MLVSPGHDILFGAWGAMGSSRSVLILSLNVLIHAMNQQCSKYRSFLVTKAVGTSPKGRNSKNRMKAGRELVYLYLLCERHWFRYFYVYIIPLNCHNPANSYMLGFICSKFSKPPKFTVTGPWSNPACLTPWLSSPLAPYIMSLRFMSV